MKEPSVKVKVSSVKRLAKACNEAKHMGLFGTHKAPQNLELLFAIAEIVPSIIIPPKHKYKFVELIGNSKDCIYVLEWLNLNGYIDDDGTWTTAKKDFGWMLNYILEQGYIKEMPSQEARIEIAKEFNLPITRNQASRMDIPKKLPLIPLPQNSKNKKQLRKF